MRAELVAIYDGHPDSPRMMYVTKGGLKFTVEQWALMQFMKRVEKKLDKLAAVSQTIAALEQIRDEAAMKPNGGAWAGGIATLCLGTLPKQTPGGIKR